MTSQAKLQALVDKWGAKLKEKMKDPVFFINEIAGIGPANARLNEYQEHWIRMIHENKRVNITAFRSSGKTECLFVSYPIFRAFIEPNWMGIVVSDKEEQAKEILTRIKQKIEHNPILTSSIPKNKSMSLSRTEITLSNGSRILSKPYTDRLRGWHVNWAGFDEAGEYRDLDVFESNAYSIITAKAGDVVVVGTPKSELDLLHTLRKNTEWVSDIFGAKDKWKDGRILWDIRYPKFSLDKKKKEVNNNIKFTREFLCKVLSSGDELFPYGVVEAAFDYERGFDDKPVEYYNYYFGIDFALSGEAGADYSAYAVYQKDPKTNLVRLVRLERYKGMSYDEQKIRIRKLANTFKPQKVIADEGTFGKAFIQELKQAHVPIKGFKFQHKRQELLEVFRNAFDTNFLEDRDSKGNLQALPFSQRKFLLSYGKHDLVATKIVDELVNELIGFGVVLKRSGSGDMTGTVKFESVKAHDDLVMACALGYWGCRANQSGEIIVYRPSEPTSDLRFLT